MSWRTDARRLAIFYAPPPDSALAAFGRSWLGRDPQTPFRAVAETEHLRLGGLSPERQADWTASPRRYGFHLTLKPPFRLHPCCEEKALRAALAACAAAQPPVALPALRLGIVADCLSLVPSSFPAAVSQLASTCVAAFDRFRAPATAAELAARRAAGLTARQDEMLARWGFPYVMDDARISLTLTDPLPARDCAWLARRLTPIVAPLCGAPLTIEDLCLFAQPAGASDFTVVERFRLLG